MKLRFLQTYDTNGVNSEPELQYWDEEEEIWTDVGFIRINERDLDEVLNDEFKY